jgi:hypothetical protein
VILLPRASGGERRGGVTSPCPAHSRVQKRLHSFWPSTSLCCPLHHSARHAISARWLRPRTSPDRQGARHGNFQRVALPGPLRNSQRISRGFRDSPQSDHALWARALARSRASFPQGPLGRDEDLGRQRRRGAVPRLRTTLLCEPAVGGFSSFNASCIACEQLLSLRKALTAALTI